MQQELVSSGMARGRGRLTLHGGAVMGDAGEGRDVGRRAFNLCALA